LKFKFTREQKHERIESVKINIRVFHNTRVKSIYIEDTTNEEKGVEAGLGSNSKKIYLVRNLFNLRFKKGKRAKWVELDCAEEVKNEIKKTQNPEQ